MEELLRRIEKIRSDLYIHAKDRELIDPLIVGLSQELDRLLNEFQMI